MSRLLPSIANSWLMSGFSGHGFKFGAIMGLTIADAIADRLAPTALSQWATGTVTSDQLTINRQPSTVNRQLPTTNYQLPPIALLLITDN